MAQLLHHEVRATVSGAFLDANTGQQVNTTLDLFAEEENPTGDWYYVPGEQYSASATFSDTQYSRVAGLTLCDPQGAVIAEAAADPPVPSLSASAGFVVVSPQIKPAVKIEGKHDLDCHWTVTITVTIEGTPPAPGTIVITVLDGSQQPPRPSEGVPVTAWQVNKPDIRGGDATDAQGVATIPNMAFGVYMIQVSPLFPGCVVTRGPAQLPKGGILGDAVGLWPHWPIRGKVWFRNAQGQVVPGDRSSVTVRTYQGQELKETLQLGEADPDGSYPYESTDHIQSGAYTVKATFTPAEGDPQEQSGEAIVPNDCLRDHPNLDGATAVNSAGAHAVVQGPAFTFTIQ
jgi:hypothetical protein